MKFRKKPIVIEAMQFTNETKGDVLHWIGSAGWADHGPNGEPILKIDTLEGVMVAGFGNWVIQGVKGEFYPCKPDIFEATYEAAE
jgi:hypothetical protein